MTKKFTTVVFDLDGTLIDGSEDIADALNKALAQHATGQVTTEQVAAALGGGPRVLVEKCLAAAEITTTEETLDAILTDYSTNYVAAPANKTRLFDTADDVLPELRRRGIVLGICTNKRTAITELVLTKLAIRDYFGAVIGSDTASRTKPNPAHLIETAQALGVPLDDVLYVGDTTIDSATASAAGVAYAHVAWGQPAIDTEYPLTSFDDLLALF